MSRAYIVRQVLLLGNVVRLPQHARMSVLKIDLLKSFTVDRQRIPANLPR